MRKFVAVLAVVAVTCGSVSVVAAQQAPAASQPAKVQPIDFRKLKELMPADAAGVKRSSNEGEKMNLGEMSFSKATAQFNKPEPADNDPSVTIEIVDYGGAPGMGEVITAWQQMEIDKESDGGHEKSTKVKDQPAYEQYRNEGKSGQVQVWVASRYYVNLQTTNVSKEELKKIADSLPIEKLKELK